MAKLFRKGKVKKVVSIVLGLVSVAGAVFGVSALAKYAKEEQKTIKPTFSVGGLTETGVYEETDDTIYTKDSFEAKGLEIKLDFDSNVKYQVFFYDELDKFISCTEVYTESQDISVPLEARARLEVTPIWGPDAPLEKEIKWYEPAKYANQLEVRVDKRQELLEKDFEKYALSDMFEFKEGMSFNITDKTLSASSEFDTYVYNCTSYEGMYFKIDDYNGSGEGYNTLKLFVKSQDGSILTISEAELLELNCDNYLSLLPGDSVYLMHYSGDTGEEVDANVFVYFA